MFKVTRELMELWETQHTLQLTDFIWEFWNR